VETESGQTSSRTGEGNRKSSRNLQAKTNRRLTELNFPQFKDPVEFEVSDVILDCLLSAYPENALELWRTLDYWEIRTLLALKREASYSPDIKLQEIKNQKFNELLDNLGNKQIPWENLDKRTLRGIKKYSFDFFNN
jgi:hypothetical protein